MKILKLAHVISITTLSITMFLSQAQAQKASEKSPENQPSSIPDEKPKNVCNEHYEIQGYDIDWMPVCVYDDGKSTFIEFDPERLDFEELPSVQAFDGKKSNTQYYLTLLDARRDKNGAIVANPMIIVNGLFERFNLSANKGTSRSIEIRNLTSK